MNVSKMKLATGIASLAILGVAIVPAVNSVRTASAAAATNTPIATAAGMEDNHYGQHGRMGDDLAAALGISVDDLRDAAKTVREQLKPAEKPTTPPTDAEREARRAEFKTALAAELGISVQQLETAMETVKEHHIATAIERIEAKVADGTLTRAEGDAAIERIKNGERPFPGGHHGPRGFGFRGPRGG